MHQLKLNLPRKITNVWIFSMGINEALKIDSKSAVECLKKYCTNLIWSLKRTWIVWTDLDLIILGDIKIVLADLRKHWRFKCSWVLINLLKKFLPNMTEPHSLLIGSNIINIIKLSIWKKIQWFLSGLLKWQISQRFLL